MVNLFSYMYVILASSLCWLSCLVEIHVQTYYTKQQTYNLFLGILYFEAPAIYKHLYLLVQSHVVEL